MNRGAAKNLLSVVMLAAMLLIAASGCGAEKKTPAKPVRIGAGPPSASPASPAASHPQSPEVFAVETAVAAPKRCAVEKPPIIKDPIRFSAKRRAEMAAYSQRRYGDRSVVLKPRVIVLHYTAGGTYKSVWSLFNSDVPNVGELPGVVAHYVIDQDGTIYELLPTGLRGRHTVGLNQVAIGIEFVQNAGRGDSWATGQILRRRRQVDAGRSLVRYLQRRYHIEARDVIGHGMANDSRFFRDRTGMRNDHGDWSAAAVTKFKRGL